MIRAFRALTPRERAQCAAFALGFPAVILILALCGRAAGLN